MRTRLGEGRLLHAVEKRLHRKVESIYVICVSQLHRNGIALETRTGGSYFRRSKAAGVSSRSREHDTHNRRSLVLFFAYGEDISHQPPDTPLSDAVATGAESFFIMSAIAGG